MTPVEKELLLERLYQVFKDWKFDAEMVKYEMQFNFPLYKSVMQLVESRFNPSKFCRRIARLENKKIGGFKIVKEKDGVIWWKIKKVSI